MRKSVQKNHNKAGFKKNHSPHPHQQKKRRFHPLKQDKIGTIFSNPLHRPLTDPSQTLRTHRTYQTYPTYPTQKASVRFTTSRAKP